MEDCPPAPGVSPHILPHPGDTSAPPGLYFQYGAAPSLPPGPGAPTYPVPPASGHTQYSAQDPPHPGLQFSETGLEIKQESLTSGVLETGPCFQYGPPTAQGIYPNFPPVSDRFPYAAPTYPAPTYPYFAYYAPAGYHQYAAPGPPPQQSLQIAAPGSCFQYAAPASPSPTQSSCFQHAAPASPSPTQGSCFQYAAPASPSPAPGPCFQYAAPASPSPTQSSCFQYAAPASPSPAPGPCFQYAAPASPSPAPGPCFQYAAPASPSPTQGSYFQYAAPTQPLAIDSKFPVPEETCFQYAATAPVIAPEASVASAPASATTSYAPAPRTSFQYDMTSMSLAPPRPIVSNAATIQPSTSSIPKVSPALRQSSNSSGQEGEAPLGQRPAIQPPARLSTAKVFIYSLSSSS